jgi:ketosteroid isomerase-like protein
MLSWLAKKLVSHNMARLNAGDPEPTLRLDAADVRFHFPGDSSWSGDFRGKAELRPWLRRFVRVGIQSFADEVVVKGFPWSQTICVRGHDYLRSPDGELVYENRYVIWGRMAWGKVRDYEVYEDTQKAKALDEYLADHEPAAAAAAGAASAAS